MIILGLNLGHDGAACVVRDGKLVAALSRERLSRIKKESGVSLELIRTVLAQEHLTLDNVDYIAISSYQRGPSELKLRDVTTGAIVTDDLEMFLNEHHRKYICEIDGRSIRTVYVQHHLAHCASAFYTSPFENAACMSMDSSLTHPQKCSLYALGSGLDLEPLYCPGLMIGNAYNQFTERLGLGNGGFKAGSTMGLAAYGVPIRHPLHDEFLKNFFERRFQTDEEFIGFLWTQLTGLSPQKRISKITQQTMDVAATLQVIFEEITLLAAQRLFNEYKNLHHGNLVLSGGSFLNCNANTAILEKSGFENLHLFPACGDDGTAVGAGLYLAHNLLREPRAQYTSKDLAYLGPEYEPVKNGEPLDLDLIAEKIAEGKVIGWFQSRSEYGPRALGHRSMLADPRSPTMRDYINSDIKQREWFRPFAPAVLAEEASNWFDFSAPSPFMLHTARVLRPEKIPAVSHVDGTARIQTVAKEDNPFFYELISRFKEKTGVPMLLNTSFNLGGEAVVETPQDALAVFHQSKIDLLVIGEKMFSKKP
jgi:carbamoyltransferase